MNLTDFFVENILELLTSLFKSVRTVFTSLFDERFSREISHLFAETSPLFLLGLFLFSSLIMIWRLNAIEKRNVEGTIIGTLIMPYCSGFANLAFAFVMATSVTGKAEMVLENCLVNNVTNLTLLLGIPALIWGMNLYRKKGRRAEEKLTHIALSLTLIAMLFFTAITWVLARDGSLNRSDGMVLIGLFLFWQVLHVFEVMKTNIRKKQSVSRWIGADLLLVGAAAWGTYYSIEKLVAWVVTGGGGLIPFQQLGIISGLLMVVPNGMLAFYYAAIKRSDIAYSSQIGDAHICIPMCIGLYALFSPITIPPSFTIGIWVILAAALTHLLVLGGYGKLPRIVGGLLASGYGFFIYKGIFSL